MTIKDISLFALALFLCVRVLGEDYPKDDSSAESVGRILLVKVRIEIGERLYEWTESGITPAEGSLGQSFPGPSGEPPGLLSETVISFLSLKPGARYDIADLDRRCRESEARLLESTLAYSAGVAALPPRRNPETRTVFVTVKPGFLWRFGGGNAFGTVGKAGIRGERFSARAFLGWNRNGAELLHERVGGLPLVLGAAAFADAPGAWSGTVAATGLGADSALLEGRLTQGWYAGPDLLFAVDEAVAGPALRFGGTVAFSVQPYVRFGKPFAVPGPKDAGAAGNARASHGGGEARLWWFPAETESAKGEFSLWYRAAAGPRFTAACKLAAGNSAGAHGFDLFGAEDRSIRSGYGREYLSSPSFAFASAEARFRPADIPLGGGIACGVEPFLFADAALLGLAESGSPGPRKAEGLGAGIRLLFDSPVFAYFTLTFGVNREGSGRFTVGGTAGY